jgi:hypothetical protein
VKAPTILCTCPGRFGDIVWAIAAAREAYLKNQPADYLQGCVVDFGVMGKYEKIIPLLQTQRFIREAFAVPGWVEVHSNWGSQPWESPSSKLGYDKVYDFGYREQPQVQLIDYASTIYPELKPRNWCVPFLSTPQDWNKVFPSCVPYHFSPHQGPHGNTLVEKLRRSMPELKFVDVGALSFVESMRVIAESRVFLGSRSSNYVIAQGLGKPCVILEMAGYRRHPKYGCSYGSQIMSATLDLEFFVMGIREALRW